MSVNQSVPETFVDSDYDDYDYYNDDGSDDLSDDSDVMDTSEKDPEHFSYQLMDPTAAGAFVRHSVDAVSKSCGLNHCDARQLLKNQQWNVNSAVKSLKRRNSQMFNNNNNDNTVTVAVKKRRITCDFECPVCFSTVDETGVKTLPSCGHTFCSNCWDYHFTVQLQSGTVGNISCMQAKCTSQVPDDFVLGCLSSPQNQSKFQELLLMDYVVSHPQLRFCPGADCNVIVQADSPAARRVNCNHCEASFCFSCGSNYHAPVDCSAMKLWTQKLEDDSETANYMVANTKDCPKCNVCIEKNGGCNHMHCYKCGYDFCWMCLGDWASHGSSYYECSKYKENPNIGQETAKTNARNALEKYLHYFQRWENHAKSLALEDQTRQKIQERINEKVMQNVGTWIDWQYLLDAANLLKRCRYTLQYTYPTAYYLESGSRKDCFECMQGQFEAEVENLSWKVERAEITDRADLERQMDVAEKRRISLLKDFLQN